ncbi:hypothetical protein DSM106972_029570 [Dulcicalothrix desertica PCC 7102]|uniref:Uncharacterized protein n=1 Tax=Dulcicalothrix desertica PCC 7102 TaxID=232991 RepID=A0A3S1DB60_9CYAN|nr:hypothetical protein [Dulcicalothrix desertica]RUT06700.1 hypothetical protein DSM106972_029570 [Dulcicalothrix desertica PCC 7102]TWH50191.1 hypothetical protein CAL7102_04479 [Dulcicalothrix desertica PCC 7102]
MGKYDKIFQSDDVSQEELSPEEAVAAIAVVTTAADVTLENVDIEMLVDILWGFEVFEQYDDNALSEIISKLISIAETDGLGALFNAASEFLTDELVLDGFAAGVSVLVSEDDIDIPKAKMPLLKQLQSVLEVEDEEANEVIEEVLTAFEEVEEDILGDETTDFAEDLYSSPEGNFTVSIPVTPDAGGKIQTAEGMVSFSDDYGTLLRIDYYLIPPSQRAEIDDSVREQYFESVLLDKYIPQAIVANLSSASVEYTGFLPNEMQGAYFALVNMPGGCTISKQENNGHPQRLDAFRGIIAFQQHDFIYIVTSQRCFFSGETLDSIDTEAETMKANILAFIDTMEFSNI